MREFRLFIDAKFHSAHETRDLAVQHFEQFKQSAQTASINANYPFWAKDAESTVRAVFKETPTKHQPYLTRDYINECIWLIGKQTEYKANKIDVNGSEYLGGVLKGEEVFYIFKHSKADGHRFQSEIIEFLNKII